MFFIFHKVENGTWNNCYRYAVNWTQILENDYIEDIFPNTSWPIEYCPSGWEYNKTEVESSIVIDVSFFIIDDMNISYVTILVVFAFRL